MLKRIQVKNFKSFKHLDYSCTKLNLLMGVNGAGKSSFVKLMLLLRNLSQRQLRAHINISVEDNSAVGSYEDLRYSYTAPGEFVQFRADFTPRVSTEICQHYDGLDSDELLGKFPDAMIPIDLNTGKKDTVISVQRLVAKDVRHGITLLETDFAQRVMCSPELSRVVNYIGTRKRGRKPRTKRPAWQLYTHDPDGFSWIWFESLKIIDSGYERKYNELESEINKGEEQKSLYFKFLWRNMKFVDAFRIKPKEVHNGGRYSDDEWASKKNVAYDPEGEDVAEFLYKVGRSHVLSKGNPMISPNCPDDLCLIDQVNAWLQVVSPGAQIKIDRREVADAERFIQSVTFGRPGYEHEFKPQDVGFGISYILPVLVSLLSSMPEDIVIIENPEAHLHPRGQAEIGALIARAAAYGVQVFVETHSDHVINGVRVAVKKGIVKPDDVNIAFFERKGHEIEAGDGVKHTEYYADVRNIKIDAKGSLSEYPEDFMDEWSNLLLRLMKPRAN